MRKNERWPATAENAELHVTQLTARKSTVHHKPPTLRVSRLCCTHRWTTRWHTVLRMKLARYTLRHAKTTHEGTVSKSQRRTSPQPPGGERSTKACGKASGPRMHSQTPTCLPTRSGRNLFDPRTALHTRPGPGTHLPHQPTSRLGMPPNSQACMLHRKRKQRRTNAPWPSSGGPQGFRNPTSCRKDLRMKRGRRTPRHLRDRPSQVGKGYYSHERTATPTPGDLQRASLAPRHHSGPCGATPPTHSETAQP